MCKGVVKRQEIAAKLADGAGGECGAMAAGATGGMAEKWATNVGGFAVALQRVFSLDAPPEVRKLRL